MKEGINEIEKLLDQANKELEDSTRNALSDTPELTGIINRQREVVVRFKSKLAPSFDEIVTHLASAA